ncbi:hypothetical protein [Oceaniovalibus sp. ACAM 378]|uniref:hypothetical protein n=1 Tax=Oceaniovalibus sp. ACAM 378 TaxID=2599923 RepID=UPI0011DC5145|nr:hypothetical protein [Oceaniovalibus sp. ACAM 378]TYB87666.1 hypothetical protein FQ320_13750 [Oceaniovalibus sp. ACAM 378]
MKSKGAVNQTTLPRAADTEAGPPAAIFFAKKNALIVVCFMTVRRVCADRFLRRIYGNLAARHCHIPARIAAPDL